MQKAPTLKASGLFVLHGPGARSAAPLQAHALGLFLQALQAFGQRAHFVGVERRQQLSIDFLTCQRNP